MYVFVHYSVVSLVLWLEGVALFLGLRKALCVPHHRASLLVVLLNCQHVYQWLRGFVNVIHCLIGHLEQVAMNCVEVCPCSVGLGVD